MLSEGRPGIDDKYSLKDGNRSLEPLSYSKLIVAIGVLRLDLAKEIYERCGLVGKVIQGGGRKHVKSRYGRHRQVLQPNSADKSPQ